MAVTPDRPGPYAPGSAVLSLIHKHRTRGLPSPIDASVLERAGVSPSLIPRTLQAIQTLDLVGEDGRPTDVLEGIRLAPEAEYQKRLADWLTDAYADALAFVDPATASETDIRDAFRKYLPTGQQDRMVSLFIALFTAAGVMPERQRQSATTRKPTAANATPRAARVSKPPLGRQPKPSLIGGASASSALPPGLLGLLAELPQIGESWTRERRDKFVAAFGTILDLCFTIGEPETVAADDQENGDQSE